MAWFQPSRPIVRFALLALVAPIARAGHPMLTEDTGTQGAGNIEFEQGYAWSRAASGHTFLFQPQLSLGANARLDLILQPSWVDEPAPQGAAAKGLGNTNLDLKWRLVGAAPYSLALRAGVEAATDSHRAAAQHGFASGHMLLAATVDLLPVTLDANLGYLRNSSSAGTRSGILHASMAVMYAANERLVYVVDSALDSNPDPAQDTPVTNVLAGAILTVHPGLDIDAGYRAGLSRAADAGQWLIGITWRWAP